MFEQMVKEAYEEVEVYRNKLNGRKLDGKILIKILVSFRF